MLLLSSSLPSPIFKGPVTIEPGIGLLQERNDGRTIEIVVFEHTSMGTGGLVLNCPTPLRLGDIPVDRYRPFGHLPLMMGCGLDNNEEGSNVALTDLAPWFWLHDQEIPGSFELKAAAGPLFMGGDLERAAEHLEATGLDPAGHFQFFRKYKSWRPGELQHEIDQGSWSFVGPQSPESYLILSRGGRS